MTTKLEIIHNPLRVNTEFKVDGNPVVAQDSKFSNSGMWSKSRLQQWIDEVPKAIQEELNDDTQIIFTGVISDAEDFEELVERYQVTENSLKITLETNIKKSSEGVLGNLSEIYSEIEKSPYEELHSKKIQSAFKNAQNTEFPVTVIATMSAGKSTTLNALLANKILPTGTEAKTAKVTEIHDNDSEKDFYEASAFDVQGNEIKPKQVVDFETLDKWNDEEKISRVKLEGDIPFVSNTNSELVFVDTPGPNNSQDTEHMRITQDVIHNQPKTLIIYLMNATQLKTNDDSALLREIAQSMKGSKQNRDRFLFVINKLDQANGEDDVPGIIRGVESYLSDFGIERAQIFALSAQQALRLRTTLKNEPDDEDKLELRTRRSMKNTVGTDVQVAINDAFELIDNGAKHFEKYGKVPVSIYSKINKKLQIAQQNKQTKTEAEIHSGIRTLEAAIRLYVEKYATASKIKSVVDSFEEELNKNQSLAKLMKAIDADKEHRVEIQQTIKRLQKFLNQKEIVESFEKQIQSVSIAEELSDVLHTINTLIGTEYKDKKKQIEANEDYQRLTAENGVSLNTDLRKWASDSQVTAVAVIQGKIRNVMEILQEKLNEEMVEILKKIQDEVDVEAFGVNLSEIVSTKVNTIDLEKIVSYKLSEGFDNADDIVETHQETHDTGARWYKPWSWGQSRYETIDVKTTLEGTKDGQEVISRFFYEYSKEARQRLEKFSQEYASNLKQATVSYYQEQVNIMFKRLNEITLELNRIVKDDQAAAATIQKNKAKLDWIEDIQSRLNRILDLKATKEK